MIVSDDSPNGEFGEMLRSDAMAPAREVVPIEIHRGPRNGAYENFKHLIRLWDRSTHLVHLLLDDDVIYPHFYARHLNVHRENAFSCSISARWTADERGQPIDALRIPEQVSSCSDRVVALEAPAMFMSTLPRCQNWFGEFSHCVLSKDSAEVLFKPELAGISYAGLWDLGAFLAASLKGPVAYLQEMLGFFRYSADSHSGHVNSKYMKAGFLAYAALARGAEKLGLLESSNVRQCYGGVAAALHRLYADEDDMREFRELLPRMAEDEPGSVADFERQWVAFLARSGF